LIQVLQVGNALSFAAEAPWFIFEDMGNLVLVVALMPLQVEVLFMRTELMRSGHEKSDPPADDPEIEDACLFIAVLSSWMHSGDRTALQVPSSFSMAADGGGAMSDGIKIQPVYGRLGSERFCMGLDLRSFNQRPENK
jgi:hypothetical protein